MASSKLEVLQKETLNHAYALPGKNFGGGSNPEFPPPPHYVHEADICDCIVQFDFCNSLLHYFTEAIKGRALKGIKGRALKLIMAASCNTSVVPVVCNVE